MSSNKQKLSSFFRFIGVSLAGGKSDKACIAILDYYPQQKKLFLTRLFEKIKSDESVSGDLKIHDLITEHKENLTYVAFDTALELPQCLCCQLEQRLKCPGYEMCREPHIQWMWNKYRSESKTKKPKKIFTPYTQRCVEMYLQYDIKEKLSIHHAMGANMAPLLARALFIKSRLTCEVIEVYPKLSFLRVGEKLNLLNSDLKNHRAAFGGESSREKFLQEMNRKDWTFVYQQDSKAMVVNSHAFEAFICAITAYLKHQKQTEPRPAQFPTRESWIEFPVKNFSF